MFKQRGPRLRLRAAPGREGVGGGRGGRFHLADRCFGRLCDHGLGRRVHDLVAAGVTVDALAADEELEPRCCHAGETRTRSNGDAYRGSQITTGMSRSVRFWYPA